MCMTEHFCSASSHIMDSVVALHACVGVNVLCDLLKSVRFINLASVNFSKVSDFIEFIYRVAQKECNNFDN